MAVVWAITNGGYMKKSHFLLLAVVLFSFALGGCATVGAGTVGGGVAGGGLCALASHAPFPAKGFIIAGCAAVGAVVGNRTIDKK